MMNVADLLHKLFQLMQRGHGGDFVKVLLDDCYTDLAAVEVWDELDGDVPTGRKMIVFIHADHEEAPQ